MQRMRNTRSTHQWILGLIATVGKCLLLFGLVALPLTLPSRQVHAGLTACEVVVVVNGQSFNSRTVANHFVALRNIPPNNVIVLDGVPASEVIDVNAFRDTILKPVLEEINRRNLAKHIQCITYSADFPTGINISEDLKPLKDLHRIYTKVGSINGLTYLYAKVNTGLPTYIDLTSNYFVRRKIEDYFTTNPGGDETLEAWKETQSLIGEEKHQEASERLEEIFDDHPHQFPIAYFAAAEAALAKQNKRAVELLERAIESGWNAGGYLAVDGRFDSVRDDEDFQTLEFLLDPSIKEFQPTIGFDARTFWAPNGVPVNNATQGVRFMLSTVLGVTRGKGMKSSEVVAGLRRSSQADFTHPQGTFYFSVTPDVRSQTRKWGFLPAIDLLQDMGFGATPISTPLPKNKDDVLGAQTGTPSYNWKSSGSTFLPGAIADNLTSFGGVMTAGSGQTKLTEFIKNGAAGSSGTVTEPYALQDKFPLPLMYVHYVRGASLAEAFYASVSGPYQLLIIGDPLCRPFSNAPQPNLDTSLRKLEPGQSLQIPLELDGDDYADWVDDGVKQAERTSSLKPTAISVMLDGINPTAGYAKRNINVKLEDAPPGYHECTFRFIADDPLAQRSQQVIPVWIGDEDLIRLTISDGDQRSDNTSGVRFAVVSQQTQTLKLRVAAKDATRVSVWQGLEELAHVDATAGDLEIDLNSLGQGPVRLQGQATLADGKMIKSLPQWLRIDP